VLITAGFPAVIICDRQHIANTSAKAPAKARHHASKYSFKPLKNNDFYHIKRVGTEIALTPVSPHLAPEVHHDFLQPNQHH
jgi:hypothetical protein